MKHIFIFAADKMKEYLIRMGKPQDQPRRDGEKMGYKNFNPGLTKQVIWGEAEGEKVVRREKMFLLPFRCPDKVWAMNVVHRNSMPFLTFLVSWYPRST